jgi:dihydroflavonol-4-reductase
MQVLVTGASGLIGGNVARGLAARGDHVVALLRPGSDAPALHGYAYRRVEGDVRDRASVERSIEGCEAVVHAAAVVSLWQAREREMNEVNVDGSRNVLAESLRARIPRVVHVSSIDALGLPPEGQSIGDEEPPSNRLMPGPYALSKRRADDVARDLAARGLPVSLIHPGFVFGPWDTKPSSGRMILTIARGMPAYPGRGANVFVGVSDVVAAVLAALERGVAGRGYIVAAHNLTYREAFTRIARVIGVRTPRLAIPTALTMALGAVGSIAQSLLGRELDVNLVTARNGAIVRTVSSSRARDELGVIHTGFDEAVEEAVRWFRARGDL